MTHWFSATIKALADKPTLVRRAFEKTGCLLTVTGKGNENISPQGLVDYPAALKEYLATARRQSTEVFSAEELQAEEENSEDEYWVPSQE